MTRYWSFKIFVKEAQRRMKSTLNNQSKTEFIRENLPFVDPFSHVTFPLPSLNFLTFPSITSSFLKFWKTHSDLCDSNHYPIIFTLDFFNQHQNQSTPKWLINKANWSQFHTTNYKFPQSRY